MALKFSDDILETVDKKYELINSKVTKLNETLFTKEQASVLE